MTLTVKINRGLNLPRTDEGGRGKIDPYFIVRFANQLYQTLTKQNDLNPVINEVFTFNDSRKKDVIYFELYDEESSGNKLIGTASVNSDALPNGTALLTLVDASNTNKNVGQVEVEITRAAAVVVQQAPQVVIVQQGKAQPKQPQTVIVTSPRQTQNVVVTQPKQTQTVVVVTQPKQTQNVVVVQKTPPQQTVVVTQPNPRGQSGRQPLQPQIVVTPSQPPQQVVVVNPTQPSRPGQQVVVQPSQPPQVIVTPSQPSQPGRKQPSGPQVVVTPSQPQVVVTPSQPSQPGRKQPMGPNVVVTPSQPQVVTPTQPTQPSQPGRKQPMGPNVVVTPSQPQVVTPTQPTQPGRPGKQPTGPQVVVPSQPQQPAQPTADTRWSTFIAKVKQPWSYTSKYQPQLVQLDNMGCVNLERIDRDTLPNIRLDNVLTMFVCPYEGLQITLNQRPLNDAISMATLYLAHGYRVLYYCDATPKLYYAWFDWVLTNVYYENVVYYCGIGQQIAASAMKEEDGISELMVFYNESKKNVTTTLVPTQPGITDMTIADYVLHKLIIGKQYPETRIVLLNDCSYSGTMFNFDQPVAQAASLKLVYVGACLDKQTAKQTQVGGKDVGMFTFALQQFLTSNKKATFLEVDAYLKKVNIKYQEASLCTTQTALLSNPFIADP